MGMNWNYFILQRWLQESFKVDKCQLLFSLYFLLLLLLLLEYIILASISFSTHYVEYCIRELYTYELFCKILHVMLPFVAFFFFGVKRIRSMQSIFLLRRRWEGHLCVGKSKGDEKPMWCHVEMKIKLWLKTMKPRIDEKFIFQLC